MELNRLISLSLVSASLMLTACDDQKKETDKVVEVPTTPPVETTPPAAAPAPEVVPPVAPAPEAPKVEELPHESPKTEGTH